MSSKQVDGKLDVKYRLRIPPAAYSGSAITLTGGIIINNSGGPATYEAELSRTYIPDASAALPPSSTFVTTHSFVLDHTTQLAFGTASTSPSAFQEGLYTVSLPWTEDVSSGYTTHQFSAFYALIIPSGVAAVSGRAVFTNSAGVITSPSLTASKLYGPISGGNGSVRVWNCSGAVGSGPISNIDPAVQTISSCWVRFDDAPTFTAGAPTSASYITGGIGTGNRSYTFRVQTTSTIPVSAVSVITNVSWSAFGSPFASASISMSSVSGAPLSGSLYTGTWEGNTGFLNSGFGPSTVYDLSGTAAVNMNPTNITVPSATGSPGLIAQFNYSPF
jgi:hypothetical protein